MNQQEWEETLEKAKKELLKSLNKFGPNEILNILLAHAHNDPVVQDLLTRFPTVVALGEFLSTLPVVRTDEKT